MSETQSANTGTNLNPAKSHYTAGSGELRNPARRKKLGFALGASAMLALGLLFSPEAISTESLTPRGYGLEGSWLNTVHPILPPGAPPLTFSTYVTFAAGGGSIGSDRTRPFSSPQHGTWVHLGGHQYAVTFVQDMFDAAGTFQGVFKGRTRLTLVGKNEYVGVANVEQHDPNGNLIFSRCARTHAVRLAPEPLASPCEDLGI